MPAVFRTLALTGAMFFSSGLYIASAHAQDADPKTAATAPTSDMSAPSTPSASPSVATPAAPSIASPQLVVPPEPAATAQSTATKKTAKTVRHKRHHVVSKKHAVSHARAARVRGAASVREAQTHLQNLGYNPGGVDGLMGPKTRAALKRFQNEHKLPVTGTLTPQTEAALEAADKSKAMSSLPVPSPATGIAPGYREFPSISVGEGPNPSSITTPGANFYDTHPDFYGYYHHQYENPEVLGTPQTLASRFAKLELAEEQTAGSTKKYTVTLNGLPLIMVDNQPAVIGVSKTYELGDEDVIIFTSFNDNDPVCAYGYHLLVLSANNTRSLEIHNCTRGYQARVDGESLFVTFPEMEANRAAGSVWRYEHGSLNRL